MKRLLFASLLILINLSIFAQQTEVTVPVTSSTKLKGWIYLPKDYNKTRINYPVVFFYHGKGEAGTNDSLLLRQGLPWCLQNGYAPDSTINPIDGKYYSFIVLSLQSPSWSVAPGYLGKEIDWVKANYRIDTNRIYVTGLSAGGQCAFRTLSTADSVSAKIAAAVIMSPASYSPIDYSLIGKYNIPTWFSCGLQDNVVGLTPTKNYYKYCDSAYQGSSNVSWIPNTSHTGWIPRYKPSFRDPMVGLSVWQWFLLYKK